MTAITDVNNATSVFFSHIETKPQSAFATLKIIGNMAGQNY
jgi:hypothetical protein